MKVIINENLKAFDEILTDPDSERKLTRNEKSILKYVNASLQMKKELVSYDINFLTKVRDLITEGHITKKQAKKIHKDLKDYATNIHLVIDVLRKNIRDEDLKTDTQVCIDECKKEVKQIILSEYFY